MKYRTEIIIGCVAGLAIAAVLSIRQWREQDLAFAETTRLQVHALARLAASQQRRNIATAIPAGTDPWGSPLTVREARVCSPGPDRRAQTPDDICAP